MKLKQLEIKNFKAIETATAENLEDVNIFVGKNNVGKSSIFESITLLKNFPIYPDITYDEIPVNLFTGGNYWDNVLEITLTYELSEAERSNIFGEFSNNSLSSQREKDLLNSAFMKNIQYVFRSFRKSLRFGLYEIRFMSEDKEFCTILLRVRQDNFSFVNFPSIITKYDMVSNILRNQQVKGDRQDVKNALGRPLELFKQKMDRTFVFSASRDSAEVLPAEETLALESQGRNLVQRIYSIKQNEDETWEKLREFVTSKLPELGSLQSRIKTNETSTVFNSSKWNFDIDLHQMGSGIQQILMIVVVLLSRKNDYLFLIEMPEHHLHPGAQRILLNFISENIKSHQIAITSHSPVFLNQRHFPIFSVTQKNKGTKIKKLAGTKELSQALQELGSRNSDLLMADFVLFVEGKTDEELFKIWAKTLGIDFDSKNVFCIPIFGCRNFDYYANSDILNRISLSSDIPHIFVIDRDEKSEETIERIKKKSTKVHILERREIENYLLNPKLILDVIKKKAQSNVESQRKLENVTIQSIKELMFSKADELKQVVILKRIREAIGGGPYLPYEKIAQLIENTNSVALDELTYAIPKISEQYLAEKCDKQKIENIIYEQFKLMQIIWDQGIGEKLRVAPGEEILAKIFNEFDLNFDKKKDGLKIAQQMKSEDIPKEIVGIIKKIESSLNSPQV